jgi:hypothetical protein
LSQIENQRGVGQLSRLWQVDALFGLELRSGFPALLESMTMVLIHSDRKTSMIRRSDYLTKLPENERISVSPPGTESIHRRDLWAADGQTRYLY